MDLFEKEYFKNRKKHLDDYFLNENNLEDQSDKNSLVSNENPKVKNESKLKEISFNSIDKDQPSIEKINQIRDLNQQKSNNEELVEFHGEAMRRDEARMLAASMLGKAIENSRKIESFYVSANWKKIQVELKEKGFNLRKINKEIGSNFRNQVYSGYNMKLSTFRKLEKLIGHDLEFRKIDPKKDYNIQRDKSGKYLSNTLNDGDKGSSSTKEKSYLINVKDEIIGNDVNWKRLSSPIIRKAAKFLDQNESDLRDRYRAKIEELSNKDVFLSKYSIQSELNNIKLKIALDNLKFTPDNTKGISVQYLSKLSQLSKNRVYRIPEFKELLEIEVAKQYIEGNTYSEIADSIGAAKRTIAPWITRDDILGRNLFNFENLELNKPHLSKSLPFNKYKIHELAELDNSRVADYILNNLESCISSLIDFIKNEFDNINFDVNKIAEKTGFSYNLLRDWLEKGRILRDMELDLTVYEKLERFEEKYVTADWEKLRQILENKGTKQSTVLKQLGIRLDNQFSENALMLYKNFQILTKYYEIDTDWDLPFNFVDKIINAQKDHRLILPRNEKTAELIGVMLGDGHFNVGAKISLDSNLLLIQDHIKHLLQEVFDQEFIYKKDKMSNKVEIRMYKQNILNGFENLGLKKGDKLNNQISVPKWIQKSPKFKISCVRGLIDTDGGIFLLKNGIINVNLTNGSVPLLDFFEKFCEENGIHTSREIDHRPQVKIRRMNDVKKFLDLVKPVKFKELMQSNPIGVKEFLEKIE